MSLKKDILTTGFVRIFGLAMGFACSLVLARWLGPEGLGLYTMFMVFPLIFTSLGELGIRQSAAYMTGKKLAPETQLARVLIMLWLMTSLFSLVFVFASYRLQGMHIYGMVYVLMGISFVPVSLVTRYANGIALGKQWIYRINIGEVLCAFTRLLLLTVFLIGLRRGVLGALVVQVISALVPGVLMLWWLRGDIGILFVPLWDKKLICSLLTHGFKFATALFVISLNYQVNILILQRFVSNSEIGQFSLGMKIAQLIWLLPAAVGMVVFSHSTSAGDSKFFVHTTSQIMRLTLLFCSLGGFSVYLFCKPFVGVVFGTEYLPSVPLIRLMLPGCMAAIVFKVLNANLAGRGYPLTGMWVYLGVLGINIMCNFLLIPIYGVNGSAIASSISYITGAVVYARIYARKSDTNLVEMFCQPAGDWRTIKSMVAKLPELHRFKQCVGGTTLK